MYLDIININYYKYVPLYIKELKLVLKLFRHVVFNENLDYIVILNVIFMKKISNFLKLFFSRNKNFHIKTFI